MSSHVRPRCFLDLAIGTQPIGRVVIELYDDKTPKTCENFRALCTGEVRSDLHYKSSIFHRVIEEFMIQGGDITKGNGTGGMSIYGNTFDDENLDWRTFDEPFLLAMANRGPATNSSQFFITLDQCPHLNGKHAIFGHVVSGQSFVKEIETTRVNAQDKPLTDIIIVNCGELEFKQAQKPQPSINTSKKRVHGKSRSRDRNRRDTRSGSRERRQVESRSKTSGKEHHRARSHSESRSLSSSSKRRNHSKSPSMHENAPLNRSNGRGRSTTPQSSEHTSHKNRHRSHSPSRSHTESPDRQISRPHDRRSRSREHHRYKRHRPRHREYDEEQERRIQRGEQEREGRRLQDYSSGVHHRRDQGGQDEVQFKGRGSMKYREKKRWGGGYGRLE